MYTTNVKFCPSCKRENPETASICAYCGTALVGVMTVRTTGHIPEQPLKVQPPDHILQLTSLYADIIALVVLGQDQPILIRGSSKVILGRYSPGDTAPSVDLSAYNAALLGVSRPHATISRPDDVYLLQDLGSTNGTWVNEVKLAANTPQALKNGDLVRLGQLAMYVYFNAEETERPAYASFRIKQAGKKDDEAKITFTTLSDKIVPFLNAVADIQKICDEVLERKPETIHLQSLTVEGEDEIVNIKLSGANESVNLLKTKYVRWQKQQITNAISDTGTTSDTSKATKSEGNGTEPKTPQSTLAAALVDDLAPFRAEDFQKTYIDKLTEPLKILLNSPFTLVVDE